MDRPILTRTSALKAKYPRKSRRYVVDSGDATISWRDPSGALKTGKAQIINISPHGIALELQDINPAPTVIWFQWAKHKLGGSGVVRYEFRSGNRLVVGLEFNDGLRKLRAGDAPVAAA